MYSMGVQNGASFYLCTEKIQEGASLTPSVEYSKKTTCKGSSRTKKYILLRTYIS